MTTPNNLKIEVYTDIVCPWCYLGKRRLEKALEAFPEVRADIRYLPYELNPVAPEEGIDRVKHLEAKYGKAIQAADERLAAFGREVGLDFHFEKAERIPNTFNAHRLAWLAGREGLQAPVVEALHEAYFTKGQDLGDKKVLVAIAEKTGLDGDKARKFLDSGEGDLEVRELEKKAYGLGISGVPFFVFNGEYAASGAQPVEVFVSILKQLMES